MVAGEGEGRMVMLRLRCHGMSGGLDSTGEKSI